MTTTQRVVARGVSAAAAILGATLALAACGDLGDGDTGSEGDTNSPTGSAATSSPTADGATGTDDSPPAVASASGTDPAAAPAIKTVEFTLPYATGGSTTFRLELTGLSRRGPFTELDGRITCTGVTGKGRCSGQSVLADRVGQGQSTTMNTAAGIRLVDPVGKKEYLPVTDTKDRPYAAVIGPSMEQDLAVPFYVNYPAVPDDVTSMTVVLPQTGQPQITDVPVG